MTEQYVNGVIISSSKWNGPITYYFITDWNSVPYILQNINQSGDYIETTSNANNNITTNRTETFSGKQDITQAQPQFVARLTKYLQGGQAYSAYFSDVINIQISASGSPGSNQIAIGLVDNISQKTVTTDTSTSPSTITTTTSNNIPGLTYYPNGMDGLRSTAFVCQGGVVENPRTRETVHHEDYNDRA
ncbi:MAG: hypothetical protein EPN21_03255 [Methylococcaceae bacterium]|nr:MAG: hypothetical protein EPN21_03255 [Methylococcaceae bacterium]